ncbi:MAG TPA: DUF4166 domain-containing protein [Alphaproteobacteria bacterium]|nr:DUF4166 domain-containing protein [Alphaproteobacteria bacterium]HAJ46294.1 DUF4166 domain-containing protein [Alphaproteobacteria bacterium]
MTANPRPQTHQIPETPAAEPDFQALVGPFGWRRLHPDVRRRFSQSHQGQTTTYSGRMLVARNWAGLVFALCAKMIGGPLPVMESDDAAAMVCVRGDGAGGVVWERWLALHPDDPPLRVASTKRLGGDGQLLECVEGGLGMVLRVFEQDHGLIFESQHYFLTWRGRSYRLPHWLTPGQCRVTHHHVSPGRFRFSLTIRHGLFGLTFLQSGIFSDPEG